MYDFLIDYIGSMISKKELIEAMYDCGYDFVLENEKALIFRGFDYIIINYEEYLFDVIEITDVRDYFKKEKNIIYLR